MKTNLLSNKHNLMIDINSDEEYLSNDKNIYQSQSNHQNSEYQSNQQIEDKKESEQYLYEQESEQENEDQSEDNFDYQQKQSKMQSPQKKSRSKNNLQNDQQFFHFNQNQKQTHSNLFQNQSFENPSKYHQEQYPVLDSSSNYHHSLIQNIQKRFNQLQNMKASNFHSQKTIKQNIPINLKNLENDPQIDKIVQKVLHKQNLENILQKKPIKKSKNTMKIEQNNATFYLEKENNQLLQKCKELEQQIYKLEKRNKKINFDVQKKQKQPKKNKKLQQKSKLEQSLQRIQERLKKAVNLGQKLTKRLQQQKQQSFHYKQGLHLTSINDHSSSLNMKKSKKEIEHRINNFQSSINEQSTIQRGRQNSSLGYPENFIKFQSPSILKKNLSIKKEIYNSNQRQNKNTNRTQFNQSAQRKYKKINKEKESLCSDCHKLISPLIGSPESAQKRHILNESSYVINTQGGNSFGNFESPNIYIEDSIYVSRSKRNSQECQVSTLNLVKIQASKTSLRQLELLERQLLKKVQQNQLKIKQYQQAQYDKALDRKTITIKN